MEEVSVRELRLVSEGKLRAFVDIQVGQFLFRDFKIIQSNGGKPWLAAPQVKLMGKDGKLEYITLIAMPKQVKEQVESVVLAAFYDAMAKGEVNERENR